ncbi:hypothetical protein R3W88_033320 [Solanum pinnatisectum]|uniref:Uncharacterized protein n=1 Tax=Solanum pinnatisectum TaxID=50273 RepID=A0AAV9K1R1_9SOLN|nr:hypothetical protein R3W88_033320 [Solanum pinnatisectum]
MVLSKDHIVNLLLECSPLETMESSRIKNFSHFVIRSSKLKRNFISFHDDEEIDHSVEVIASNLHHLKISGSHHVLKCRLVDMSSVINNKLTFDITSIKDI